MPTTNHRNRSKQRFWPARVRVLNRSGLTVWAFCRQRGLGEPSFYGWLRTLAPLNLEPVQFVPIQVAAASKTLTRI